MDVWGDSPRTRQGKRQSMTKTVTLTVGWTNSDMEHGYSSFCDGYRPGAEQHTETFIVEVEEDMVTPMGLAEMVFEATNNPYLTQPQGVLGQVFRAVKATGFTGEGFHYSLSTGDTVTVDGVMYACENSGWAVVEEVAA